MRILQLISSLAASGGKRETAQLEGMFLDSAFGVSMKGLPKGEHGTKLVIDGSGAVSMQDVGDPQGRKMIKACADPDLFDLNYPGFINATMTGGELLAMADKLPDAEGILICSAISFHSFPIYKAAYPRLRRAGPMMASRQWWQIWKHA